jgi:hypothetical protein
MDCDDKTLAGRLQAYMDSLFSTDNGKALGDAVGLPTLHYAGYKSQLDGEISYPADDSVINFKGKLESPYSQWRKKEGGTVGFIKESAHWLLGHHPDTIRPNEVLGDDIVRPLEDAYHQYVRLLTKQHESGAFDNHIQEIEAKNFNHPDLREKLMEVREDSGWHDAMADAKDSVLDKFDGDDPRLQYGLQWLKNLERDQTGDFLTHTLGNITTNITENLLRNNLVASARNYFDRLRAGYEFGWTHYQLGVKQYKEAKASGHLKELEQAGAIGSGFIEKHNGPNLFVWSEQGNKGITYYAAKAHALANGKSETAARLYGRSAVEQLQFQSSYINRPRLQWGNQGRTNLALLSFAIGERRWYVNTIAKMTSANKTVAQNAARTLLYYSLGNGILFGPNAALPTELQATWKALAPEGYTSWRKQAGAWGALSSALDVSLDEISSPSLTNLGIVAKAVPVVYEMLSKAKTSWGQTYDHPDDPKKWLDTFKSTIMLMPSGGGVAPLNILGNKNIGNLVEFGYRGLFGDYDRKDHGSEYESSFGEEVSRVLIGGRSSLRRELDE